MASTDKYTISIMAIKAWQDIWARTFGELPLRVTLEYLIQSELDWLNQDFKHLISNQARRTPTRVNKVLHMGRATFTYNP